MSYDTLRQHGYSHRCPDCNRVWCDYEGGCDCGTCEVCGNVMDADNLDEYGRCFKCAEEEELCEECEDAE